MATVQMITEHTGGAEVAQGAALCKQRARELLSSMNLPEGLLPLDDMSEVGYNKSSGFVWVKGRSRVEHKFRAIGKTVSYDSEITAFVENGRMKSLTGIKSKELLIWVSISEICISTQDPGKIIFFTPSGLSRSFPVSAFQNQE